MILIDWRNVSHAAISVAQAKGENVAATGAQLLLGKIRNFNVDFREEFGELVLCNDHISWRNKVFPEYKGQRRLQRINNVDTDQLHPLHEVFDLIKDFWEKMEETGPYKCIKIKGAEADDIIAILARTPGKHVVVSADKDISQLTRFKNVTYYNPIKKMKIDNGPDFWHYLVVRGDPGDGVPNILSDDDTFMVSNKRQRQLRQPVVDQIVNSSDPEKEILSMKFSGIFSEQVLINYRRNKRLIDLTQIPSGLRDIVIEKSKESVPQRDMMNMIMKLGVPFYASKLHDFVPNTKVQASNLDDMF